MSKVPPEHDFDESGKCKYCPETRSMSNEQRTAISDHCMHGKHIVDRCEQCEADIAAGKGSGFTREQRTAERFDIEMKSDWQRDSIGRYVGVETRAFMSPAADGSWRRNEDYERLERQNKALREDLRKIVEAWDSGKNESINLAFSAARATLAAHGSET